MNRNQMIDALSDATNISKRDVTAILDQQDRLIGEQNPQAQEEFLSRFRERLEEVSA